MKRYASSYWSGSGLEGSGHLTTQSGVLDSQPYSTRLRFQNEDGREGTNPEELIAAAHAGCFNMALSFQLAGAGFTPDSLDTKATVSLGKEGNHYFVEKIDLHLKAKVPNISSEKFEELANNAKVGCPISKALSAVPIELTTEFSN